jgi:Kef-type K+ transport system membrane component KefB
MYIKTISIPLFSNGNLGTEFVAKFALFLVVLLFITILTGKILKLLLKLPTVAGQIIGGVLLGPSLLNIQKMHYFYEPIKFIDTTKNYVANIASTDLFMFFVLLLSSTITVSYLLWLAGHETNVQDMAKVGVESTMAGILSAIVPIILVGGTIYLFLGQYYSFAAALGQGVIFAATSVSIPIAMLISYGKMNLRSAKATIGASIIDDILAIVIFSIFTIILQSGMLGNAYCSASVGECKTISESLIRMLAAFFIMFIIGKLFIRPFTKILTKRKTSHLIPPFAALMMLAFFSLSELIGGLAGITGAYFAGLFHRGGDKKHKAVRAVSPFVNTIMLPLFLGSVGMQVDVTILKPTHWLTVFILLFVAIISKLIGCHLSTAITNLFISDPNKKWKFWESYIFGSAMVARGEVGLVIATILNGTDLLSSKQYVITVAAIILTSIASPIMLLLGFKKIEKNSEDSEFAITIGPFKNISTRHLFDVITGYVEKTEKAKPIISLTEGRKILTLSKNTKIILKPEKGIILKGNENKIKDILKVTKEKLTQDIESIPVKTEEI